MNKRKFLRTQVVAFALVCLVASCSKENEETIGGNNGNPTPATCDTVNMAYTANVLPIIRGNCYSCHGNGVVTSGINLDGYANLKRQVDNGNLVNVINHNPGYPQMPYGLPKLAACDILKIEAWVKRGAPNN